MNTARVAASKDEGPERTLKEERLDPLPTLYTPGDCAHATVGFTLGTQIDFGRVKVTAYVTYQCDQVTPTVDRAGLLAFEKALELLNDGLAVMAAEGAK